MDKFEKYLKRVITLHANKRDKIRDGTQTWGSDMWEQGHVYGLGKALEKYQKLKTDNLI